MVNGLGGVEGDQAGLSALGSARCQHGCPVIAEAPRQDCQMAVGGFVGGGAAAGGIAKSILRQGPNDIAGPRAGEQPDIVGDLEPPHVWPGRFLEQAGFGGAHSEGDGGFDGCALGFTRVRVQTRGDIHGQDRGPSLVDPLHEPYPLGVERTVQPDAEEAVDNQRGPKREQRFQPQEGGFRVGDLQRIDPAARQVFARAPGILAVMALAGQEQDQIVGLRQPQRQPGHALADAADDFRLRLTGGPRGLFPIPHLRNTDYRAWHPRNLVWCPRNGQPFVFRAQRRARSAAPCPLWPDRPAVGGRLPPAACPP